MLHVFTMQKKLNSVINKLVLVAQRKMSGSYESSYRICTLVCLLGYGCLFFSKGFFPCAVSLGKQNTYLGSGLVCTLG